jgi:cytochrome c-type biogenesis protein CcmH/NrfG
VVAGQSLIDPAAETVPAGPEATRRIDAAASVRSHVAGHRLRAVGPRPAGARLASIIQRSGVQLAIGAALLVGAGILVLRPAPRSSAPSAVSAAMLSGDLETARVEAERAARDNPRDGRAFASLGHVLFAKGEKVRALAAYREACHLDPAVGASPELLANLRATFADPVHGEAAFRLTEAIGAPAEPILRDLAVGTGDARLKRRAAEAVGRIRTGGSR